MLKSICCFCLQKLWLIKGQPLGNNTWQSAQLQENELCNTTYRPGLSTAEIQTIPFPLPGPIQQSGERSFSAPRVPLRFRVRSINVETCSMVETCQTQQRGVKRDDHSSLLNLALARVSQLYFKGLVRDTTTLSFKKSRWVGGSGEAPTAGGEEAKAAVGSPHVLAAVVIPEFAAESGCKSLSSALSQL